MVFFLTCLKFVLFNNIQQNGYSNGSVDSHIECEIIIITHLTNLIQNITGFKPIKEACHLETIVIVVIICYVPTLNFLNKPHDRSNFGNSSLQEALFIHLGYTTGCTSTKN